MIKVEHIVCNLYVVHFQREVDERVESFMKTLEGVESVPETLSTRYRIYFRKGELFEITPITSKIQAFVEEL